MISRVNRIDLFLLILQIMSILFYLPPGVIDEFSSGILNPANQ